MFRPRTIPCLLLRGGGLVKTIKFKDPKYLGDPINVVRIFNEKQVDEVVFLDITATIENRGPSFNLLEHVAEEAFMPLGYGGGVRSIDQVKTLLGLGVEKVIINTYAFENPAFIQSVANSVGSQSVVVSVDVKKSRWGKYETWVQSGRLPTGLDPVAFAVEMEKRGAGEILLNSIDRDGTMQGYDLDLVGRVTAAVHIPVVACGGAGRVQDLGLAVQAGASAAAAGSMFVFQGPHRAVLISYPNSRELRETFEE